MLFTDRPLVGRGGAIRTGVIAAGAPPAAPANHETGLMRPHVHLKRVRCPTHFDNGLRLFRGGEVNFAGAVRGSTMPANSIGDAAITPRLHHSASRRLAAGSAKASVRSRAPRRPANRARVIHTVYGAAGNRYRHPAPV